MRPVARCVRKLHISLSFFFDLEMDLSREYQAGVVTCFCLHVSKVTPNPKHLARHVTHHAGKNEHCLCDVVSDGNISGAFQVFVQFCGGYCFSISFLK